MIIGVLGSVFLCFTFFKLNTFLDIRLFHGSRTTGVPAGVPKGVTAVVPTGMPTGGTEGVTKGVPKGYQRRCQKE